MGVVRRLLKRLGPTWASSPFRRVMQAICFILFLWLFFYSCWPYRAQPTPLAKGWLPVEIDAESGRVRITSEYEFHSSMQRGSRVHISDESNPGQKPAYLGPFEIEASSAAELQLRPVQIMPPDALEKLSVSTGPWTLSLHPPNRWPSHYADEFAARDRIPVESFLLIDPLVSLSTALAAKAWIWSLWGAALILAAGVFIPRGFCGYICPLGTLIDLFDWAIGKRVKRFRVPDNGWWVHIKYYLLLGVLVAALGGVLLSGVVSAIPVLTRGLLFLLAPLQLGFARGWHQVPPMNLGQFLSILLFLAVLGLGLFRARFWCKYVCPSGAVFSLGNLFRVSERKVEDTCIHCNKCVEICPFDAIKPDFTTRVTDCTLCQTCGGVCPTHAIKFVERSNGAFLKLENDPPTHEHSVTAGLQWLFRESHQTTPETPSERGCPTRETATAEKTQVGQLHSATEGVYRLDSLPQVTGFFSRQLRRFIRSVSTESWRASFGKSSIGRRSFIASGVGLIAGVTGGLGSALVTRTLGARLDDATSWRPVRPPGSVPEQEFLELCIRCGECFKVCPNNVLQPLGFQQGLEGLWSPHVVADWAGCEPSCNACGQACPTSAIRALPLAEKKVARMGLAAVNLDTCLPWAGKEACQLCVDECTAAGYDAIEFVRVHTQADESGKPMAGSGFLAPKVQPDRCVGCGLCQMRCHSINVKTKNLLRGSAIIIEAGEGKEDRMRSGSYLALRKQLPAAAGSSVSPQKYLPEFLEGGKSETPSDR
jgi:ferredoxin